MFLLKVIIGLFASSICDRIRHVSFPRFNEHIDSNFCLIKPLKTLLQMFSTVWYIAACYHVYQAEITNNHAVKTSPQPLSTFEKWPNVDIRTRTEITHSGHVITNKPWLRSESPIYTKDGVKLGMQARCGYIESRFCVRNI